MIETFMNVVSEGVTVQQRDFVKSMLVTFPLFYCGSMIVNAHFLEFDILTRCMVVVTCCMVSNFFSFAFQKCYYFLIRKKMRGGLFFYICPIIALIVGGLNTPDNLDNNPLAVVENAIEYCGNFYLFFGVIAGCVAMYYRFTHKADNRPCPFTSDTSADEAEEKHE